MTTASINDSKASREIKTSLWDVLAKKIVLKALKNIQVGRLLVEDEGQVFGFGESAENAAVTAHISVHHLSTYRDVLFGGSIGAGEAFMLGSWSSPDLLKVIRVMVLNIEALNKMDSSWPVVGRLASRLIHSLNANTHKGSKKNISAHYDLGNDFFSLFLDPAMMYSSAVYPSADASLEQASEYKLDLICQKLQLGPKDHVIEIGTGWGGFAIHAAKNYGCKVTTTTISKEQHDYTIEAVKRAGLEEKVFVLLEDYRDLQGQYDKLVSIEMIEAVGHRFYDSYFSKCSSLLKDNGLMLVQAITIADQRYHEARKNVDFIQRYIFPGGCLPSNEVIANCVARKTDMMIIGLQDIGEDYAKTLAEWRRRFHRHIDAVRQQGFDDIFCRMWEFYLCYCEGGFTERVISTSQILFAKPSARQLTRPQ